MKEYDIVKTLVEREGFEKGERGIIVSFYPNNEACTLEILDKNNYPKGVATYAIDEVELWNK